ncbi:putative quinol monooxygenase [Nocardia sp. NPDC058705]|uniref:putative quinol monooxygenase n=1 Tax=Nocardia sp. NPDC058705 TaxID=3346609 RepID=UPI0036C9D735
MSAPLSAVVLIATHPGKGPDQIAAFNTLAPLVRAEPGCLRYDLHSVPGNPDRFVLFEEWKSAEALAAHDSSEHMRAADIANKAFRAGPAELIVIDPKPVA